MYCRNCEYNLRGQTESRCPECGEAFDPADSSTYWAVIPGWFERRNLPKHAAPAIITIFFVGLWMAGFLLWTGRPLVRGWHGPYAMVDGQNFRYVLATWRQTAIEKANRAAPLSPIDLREEFERRLSPAQQRDEVWARYNFVETVTFPVRATIVIAFVYTVLLTLVSKGRLRKRAACGILATTALFVPTLFPNSMAKLFWPGDLKYLNDYGYVPTVNWTPAPGEKPRVVAYTGGNGRPLAGFLVGLNDGSIQRVDPEGLERLAESEGFSLECPPTQVTCPAP